MMKMISQLYLKYKQVIAYLFWGVLTTVLNFIVFEAMMVWAPQVNYEISNGVAWLISALFAYVTNRIWVFHSCNHGLKAYLKELFSFMVGRFGSLLVEDVILWIGITLLGFDSTPGQVIVKIIGEIFVIIFNYFWSKFEVFKNRLTNN